MGLRPPGADVTSDTFRRGSWAVAFNEERLVSEIQLTPGSAPASAGQERTSPMVRNTG
jgi:hypothetical protein